MIVRANSPVSSSSSPWPPRTSSLPTPAPAPAAQEVAVMGFARRVGIAAAPPVTRCLLASVVPRPPASPQPANLLRFQLATAAGDQLFAASPARANEAAAKWLSAWDCNVDAAGYDWIAGRSRTAVLASERGLLYFHLATLAPRAELARRLFTEALQLEPQVASAMDALTGHLHAQLQRRDGAVPAVYRQRFTRNYALFLPLYGQAKRDQEKLVDQLKKSDFAGAKVTAEGLLNAWPNLLAPRAALFVCQAGADTRWVAGHQGPKIDKAAVKAFQMAKIMTRVTSWQADDHQSAVGGLSVEAHRYVWTLFLDSCYWVEPTVHGAGFDRNNQLVHLAKQDRTYVGMPYGEAVRLPLARRWFDRVGELGLN